MEKYVLFTNLQYATFGEMRLHVNALLLTECPHPLRGNDEATQKAVVRELRGYGPDPAWAVFHMPIPSIRYCLEDNFNSMVSLKLADGGPFLTLLPFDNRYSVNSDTISGPDKEDGRTILRVWTTLKLRVEQFWDAPSIPKLTHSESSTWRYNRNTRR